MILGQISIRSAEPLRGSALRDALRSIIGRDLNPPLPAAPAAAIQTRLKPGNRHLPPDRKARMVAALQAANARRFANRPEGCITLTEVAERAGVNVKTMANRIKKACLTRQIHDGTYAWHNVAKLVAAGLLPESS